MKYLIIMILALNNFVFAEFKLEIKKQDGSIYWVEHFTKRSDLNKWLATEMTRDYWREQYTHSITEINNAPPAKTQEEIQREQKMQMLENKIKAKTATIEERLELIELKLWMQ